MASLEDIYCRLPAWAQHVAMNAYGVAWYWKRFGPGFRRYTEEYQSRDYWTEEAWRDWQQARLAELLYEAAEHVPYYQHAWTPEQRDAARAGQLDALPLLDKEVVRASPEAFVRPDLRRAARWAFRTAGTTGTPLRTYWTREEFRRSMAVRAARSLGWAGVSYRMPRATFGSRIPVPDLNTKGPFYRFNLVERQVYFSGNHLRPETAASYVRALHRHGIQWITGYTAACYYLARLIVEQQLTPPRMIAVIPTSENMTAEMRETISRAFDCPVFEEYGSVEHTALATDCQYGRLHLSPDVGILEILRPDGTPCGPNEIGEVVGTSLLHTSQPLIRYRQGDLAAWDPLPCPCGRAMPIIKEIVGRVEDTLIAPDGRRLFRFTTVFGVQPHIRQGQVIQEALDRFRLKVVPAPGFSADDTEDLIVRTKQLVGDDVSVVVECVDQVPRTASGKVVMVVSHLDRQQPEHPAGVQS